MDFIEKTASDSLYDREMAFKYCVELYLGKEACVELTG